MSELELIYLQIKIAWLIYYKKLERYRAVQSGSDRLRTKCMRECIMARNQIYALGGMRLMPEEKERILELHDGGFTIEEIAEKIDFPIAAVKRVILEEQQREETVRNALKIAESGDVP